MEVLANTDTDNDIEPMYLRIPTTYVHTPVLSV